jgi:hypothetical protein
MHPDRLVLPPAARGGCARLAAALVVAAALAGGVRTASARPAGDCLERFGADPRANPAWFAAGSWRWEPSGTTLVSAGAGDGTLLWTRASSFTGTLALRFMLPAAPGPDAPRVRAIFAFDPASGAHRWVEVAAGSPGSVAVGQTGAVGGSAAGVIQRVRTPVATGAWQDLQVTVAGDKSVVVSLGGARLLTAGAAPLAQGLVGFGAHGRGAVVDAFSFTADPDGEPCRECHAGQADQPLAADVYTYWNGAWWDATYGGAAYAQQGGHGDPGGKAPGMACTGASGCHAMREPTPAEHRDGLRQGREHRSLNSFHLRTEFIVAQPRNPWDAQVAFDNACATLCHKAWGVGDMRHARDSVPAVNAVQLGTHMTARNGEALSVPVDSDITTRATTAEPDFAVCVSCHDPHGTGTADASGGLVSGSNRMLRAAGIGASSALCLFCHI